MISVGTSDMKPSLILAVGLMSFAQAFAGACKSDKRVTGACFTVHGRISHYNGTSSTRIWVIGTHHMLSVPSEDTELPENLRKLMATFYDEVYGDFLVCPFTREKAGEMQLVCIEAVKNLKLQKKN